MILNSFLKWTRLLPLSTLFINDLHTWIFIRIAWSPMAFQINDHVDWKMNTSEKPGIQKAAEKLIKRNTLSHILPIFIFLLKIWRNVRHGFARGYWAVQNVLAIQCQRPKPSFGRGTFTWRSSLAIGRYCQRRWGCLPQSECIFRLRSFVSSLITCTIQFVVFLRLPP